MSRDLVTSQIAVPATPVAATDAASKSYVDATVAAPLEVGQYNPVISGENPATITITSLGIAPYYRIGTFVFVTVNLEADGDGGGGDDDVFFLVSLPGAPVAPPTFIAATQGAGGGACGKIQTSGVTFSANVGTDEMLGHFRINGNFTQARDLKGSFWYSLV